MPTGSNQHSIRSLVRHLLQALDTKPELLPSLEEAVVELFVFAYDQNATGQFQVHKGGGILQSCTTRRPSHFQNKEALLENAHAAISMGHRVDDVCRKNGIYSMTVFTLKKLGR